LADSKYGVYMDYTSCSHFPNTIIAFWGSSIDWVCFISNQYLARKSLWQKLLAQMELIMRDALYTYGVLFTICELDKFLIDMML
jgi:hypothetical protein